MKPLLAEVEARYEGHPLPLFNEIRMFTDHIARCYRSTADEEFIQKQLSKAEGHLNRTVFDCFKFLIVLLHKELDAFERKYRNVDLAVVADGQFFIKYKRLRRDSLNAVANAKKLETLDRVQSFEEFQNAYNLMVDLESCIVEYTPAVNRARVRFSSRRVLKFLGWLAAAAISGAISSKPLWDWLGSLFGGTS